VGKTEPRGERERAREVTTLGAENKKERIRRLVLRPNLISRAGWPEEGPLELVAHGIEPGRLRLHLRKNLDAWLEARRRELEQSQLPDADEMLAAFELEFIKVGFSTGSSDQLLLPNTAAFHLGLQKAVAADVVVETVGKCIDILSLDFVARRQRELQDREGLIPREPPQD
jgi:hypothetical protein